MNKERRKRLEATKQTYADLAARLRAVGLEFDDLRNELDELREEEQDAYDNLPDSLRDGEKGDLAQTAIEAIETAIAMTESITEFCESHDEGEFYAAIVEATE